MIKSTFKKMIDSPQPVLLDFYADWCGPSHILSPILERLKTEVGNQAKIIKINVETNGDLVDNLDIQSIPTILIFQNGELKWRANGVQTLPVLKQQIKGLTA